ncbi:glycosyltransferase [Aestuariivirga sp.]|uniref:glycosyltransferase n=1 Tax=Aestuariivirga sp. TaxID=2650926 RepID=UPI003BA926F9
MTDVPTQTPVTTGETTRAPALVPLMSKTQRLEYLAGMAIWLAALLYFWVWWFNPAHYAGLAGYVVTTTTLAWVTLLPAYFMVVFYRATTPSGPLRLPRGSRVAMVVTKAPSEPFSVVVTTLKGMLAQDVPHDTWLADEDPSLETLEWCRRHGVYVSTRKGREDYHRKTWPRRTRCKEGNLAFFYDHYGYAKYDFVVQLDADHVPDKVYLWQMLRPFGDDKVGYVSAPSICDSNAAQSWSARGRLYAEASMHGSLQAGYNSGLAPLCIGSHYAVRTAALKEIGGLGPELAEDHSTTLMMNAFGWRGVHALDAIAHGEGPHTFADLVTQEFQWSRSLVMILIKYTPAYLSRLPARLKFQFLFSQLWYPLFALMMAVMFFIPVLALLTGETNVNVTYPQFVLHFAPLSFVLIALSYRWRATRSYRPFNVPVLSWELVFFQFARWPWALAGTIAAIRDCVAGTVVEYRITPKGRSEVDPLPFRVLAPYALLSFVSALSVVLIDNPNEARGFYIFALTNAALYALLLLVIIVQHSRENVVRRTNGAYRAALAMTFAAVIVLTGTGTAKNGMAGVQTLAWGTGRVSLFKETYSIAGAGLGDGSIRKIRFEPRWLPPDNGVPYADQQEGHS